MSEKKEQQASEEEEQDEKNEDSEEEEESSDESEEQVDWKERALKAERAIIAAKQKEKAQSEEVSTEGDDDLRETVEKLSLAEKKRQFGYEHDLSPEEVDKVFQIDSDPSKETLEDPFVKSGLQGIRKTKRVDKNTPSSSTKTTPTASKDFKELSPQEKDAEWQKYMKKKGVVK